MDFLLESSYYAKMIHLSWSDPMLLYTGGGAYVVIDKRKKTDANSQETSSDDGEMFSLSNI